MRVGSKNFDLIALRLRSSNEVFCMAAILPSDAIAGDEQTLPPDFQRLSILLDDSPETLASGNPDIQVAALAVAKHIFDLSVQSESSSRHHVVDLISSLAPSQAPQTRSKMKAQAEHSTSQTSQTQKAIFDFSPIASLFVDGMDVEQIWVQLDLRTQTICRMLDFVLEGVSSEPGQHEDEDKEESSEDGEELLQKALAALEQDEDVDMDKFMAKYGLDDVDELLDSADEETSDDFDFDDGDEQAENAEGEEEGEEDISPLRDPSDEDSDSDSPASQLINSILKKPQKRKKNGPNGPASELDDGFFSLAEFNADTERAEAKSTSRGKLAGDDSDDDEMEVDLFTSVDAIGDEGGLEERELFYRDFFEPPTRYSSTSPAKSKKQTNGLVRFHEEVRVKRIKPTGKNRPMHEDSDEDDEEEDEDEGEEDDDYGEDDSDEDEDEEASAEEQDLRAEEKISGEISDESSELEENTIQRLKHDLSAHEEDDNEDDRTTHEKRMAALREQIAQLESENVAPKEWTLMGEASSRQRTQNSLLEEDLDFDRVMKAVPVITEEVVQSLEETIKARILEGRFDDVVRIRPREDKPFLPSKFLELQDTKSTQSLAQIYENEFVASQAGGALPDDRDGKLQREHQGITALWEKICGKLDALCNVHYVPKQPKAAITTVSNVATASLESALPTSKATTTMLAPEEVFSASSSALQARSELTPAEKRTLRTKERKQKKRQRDTLDRSVDKFAKARSIGGVKKQKQAALDSIVKHGKGVTVVGKKGTSSGSDSKRKRQGRGS
ncbi:unnamed protein product [Cyclocybe aegerita]|uniref:Uncharacterized protein n=1 Tax=Cyclocybe aegerita TaxID=1973307 RepID=A0A8S0WN66_CYCAE|nr:unnamed protein product [Cyclocybe aegerita]